MRTEINHLCYIDDDGVLRMTTHPNLPTDDRLDHGHARMIYEVFGLSGKDGEDQLDRLIQSEWTFRGFPIEQKTYELVYRAYRKHQEEQERLNAKRIAERATRVRGGTLTKAKEQLPYSIYRRVQDGEMTVELVVDILALYGVPDDIARDIWVEVNQRGWPSGVKQVDHIKEIGADLKKQASQAVTSKRVRRGYDYSDEMDKITPPPLDLSEQ